MSPPASMTSTASKPRSRTVAELHARVVKVICYIDVGSWETYRPDERSSRVGIADPTTASKKSAGSTSAASTLQEADEHRFDMCARKGFDAVEPDNVAGWEKENNTGFKITRADQLQFNRWVARRSTSHGMSVALKNDGRQTKELSPASTSPSSRSASSTNECGFYTPFIEGARPSSRPSTKQNRANTAPRQADRLQFDPQVLDLFAQPWRPCDP